MTTTNNATQTHAELIETREDHHQGWHVGQLNADCLDCSHWGDAETGAGTWSPAKVAHFRALHLERNQTEERLRLRLRADLLAFEGAADGAA